MVEGLQVQKVAAGSDLLITGLGTVVKKGVAAIPAGASEPDVIPITHPNPLPPVPPGGTGEARLPLSAVPQGEATLEVLVEPVPGEAITDDNEYTYTVVFG